LDHGLPLVAEEGDFGRIGISTGQGRARFGEGQAHGAAIVGRALP